MTLEAVEFIRRFLLHVLPSGFVRIRQFGFLANRLRAQKLELCRSLLAACQPSIPIDSHDRADTEFNDLPCHRCPVCNLGKLILIERLGVEPMALQDTS